MKSKTIAVFIDAPAAEIYDYVSRPENLPCWVPSFFRSIRRERDMWIVDSPLGDAVFSFVAKNPFGVLDHRIRLASGVEFYNPMRVIANDAGSEVLFTLFQTEAMSDEDFSRDAELVHGDLITLRGVIEERRRRKIHR